VENLFENPRFWNCGLRFRLKFRFVTHIRLIKLRQRTVNLILIRPKAKNMSKQQE
jgi:hypothetical protein